MGIECISAVYKFEFAAFCPANYVTKLLKSNWLKTNDQPILY